MKTKIFLPLLILFYSVLSGQTEKIKVKKPLSTDPKIDSLLNLPRRYSYLTVDIYYGFKSFKNSFYNQLNNINLNSPITILGFGISDYDFMYNPRGHDVFQMSLYTYQKSSITVSDTNSSKIMGFSYNFGIGKMFASKNRRFSLPIYLGFNTGRLKLNLADGSQTVNPFFSPKLSVQPKIMVTRKLSLSLIIDYEYDISKTLWKKSSSVSSLTNLNQSGLVGLISLGYGIK